MRHTGGGMSHAKHRAAPWGQVTRKHRAEVTRLLQPEQPKRQQEMFESIRDLMDRRSRR